MFRPLTDNFDRPETLRENIFQVALDYLAVGLDPTKCAFVIQSQIPEIAELTVPLHEFGHGRSRREKPDGKNRNRPERFRRKFWPLGFFCYPVSQAADITAFDADLVPVGADQAPMIELTRDIVERFNRLYGKTLILPKPMYAEFGRLPGTDGRRQNGQKSGQRDLFERRRENRFEQSDVDVHRSESRDGPRTGQRRK